MPRFLRESSFGRVQGKRRLSVVAARKLEDDARLVCVDVAYPADVLAALGHATAACTGGFDHDLENHGQERTRVVRRRQGVTDEGERLAGIRMNAVPSLAAVVLATPCDRS